jgi:hypothetical protein
VLSDNSAVQYGGQGSGAARPFPGPQPLGGQVGPSDGATGTFDPHVDRVAALDGLVNAQPVTKAAPTCREKPSPSVAITVTLISIRRARGHSLLESVLVFLFGCRLESGHQGP